MATLEYSFNLLQPSLPQTLDADTAAILDEIKKKKVSLRDLLKSMRATGMSEARFVNALSALRDSGKVQLTDDFQLSVR
jgi:hypothetical protein